MPEASSTQVNVSLINASFFFYSHATTFAEPSASQQYAMGAQVAANVASVALTGFDVVLTNKLEKGYETLKPIPVKIQKSDNEFLASFQIANIHASGTSWLDAVLSLRSLILDIYDSLISETASLSPPAKRQLATLVRYVKTQ